MLYQLSYVGVYLADGIAGACRSSLFLAKLATALGSEDRERVRKFALVLSVEAGLPSCAGSTGHGRLSLCLDVASERSCLCRAT